MAGFKRYRKDSEVSYALGITLTFELLYQKPEQVDRVYLHSECKPGEALDKLEALCKQHHIEIRQTDKIFHVLSQKENCYVIGEFRKFYPKLDEKKSHLVLVNPSNAGNLGTIIRSGVGFGIEELAIIRPAVDIFDPKVVRASMGAIFRMNFTYYESFSEYEVENGSRCCYPFMLDAKKSLQETEFHQPFSLIFGNEATGLPDSFSRVGTTVIIPHTNHIDSLNLPIAASIALYEATKQNFNKSETNFKQ